MCIIIAKNSGVDMPNNEILSTCWHNNPDGGGFMYQTKDKQVQIVKGFMSLADLKGGLEKVNLSKEDIVVIHFRTATSGKIDEHTTHPFPINRKINKLKQLNIKATKGVAHNGILSSGTAKMSDTMEFIINILSDPVIHNHLSKTSIRWLLDDYLGLLNKLVIMDCKGIKLIGAPWIEDKKTKLWFSNDGYKVRYVYTESLAKFDYYKDFLRCPYCGRKYVSEANVADDDAYFYYCDYCGRGFDYCDTEDFEEYCVNDNLNSDAGISQGELTLCKNF